MRRASLEKKYSSNDSFKAYRKRKNYCNRLYKKEKKDSLEN